MDNELLVAHMATHCHVIFDPIFPELLLDQIFGLQSFKSVIFPPQIVNSVCETIFYE